MLQSMISLGYGLHSGTSACNQIWQNKDEIAYCCNSSALRELAHTSEGLFSSIFLSVLFSAQRGVNMLENVATEAMGIGEGAIPRRVREWRALVDLSAFRPPLNEQRWLDDLWLTCAPEGSMGAGCRRTNAHNKTDRQASRQAGRQIDR